VWPEADVRRLSDFASSCVNNKVWHAAAQEMKSGEPGDVFALACLVRWNIKSRGDEHFAYKDMSESIGPAKTNAPSES